MALKISKEEYGGWPNCHRLSNGIVDLAVTTDVGPRIIRFGFVEGENEFKEYPGMLGQTGSDEWRIYGGHRLWVAPEDRERTYQPDNERVALEEDGGTVRLVQPTEPANGIQKEIEVRLSDSEPLVEVTHRLRNTNASAVELAPWAISAMAPGGRAIIPLPPRGSHEGSLLPTSTIALWAYTDMTDARWAWCQRYVALRQDANPTTPQKAGFVAPDGWAAYQRDDHVFLKRFVYSQDGRYPDLGCNVEVFTNKEMLELETLGTLVCLQPGAVVEHVERWSLFRGVEWTAEPGEEALSNALYTSEVASP